jgi:hypothetical protein
MARASAVTSQFYPAFLCSSTRTESTRAFGSIRICYARGPDIRHAPGELHRDPANLWDRLKSSIRFTLCADSGLSF